MACNKEDVSKVKLGKLSPFTVNFLRDMRDFLGVTFKLKPNDEDGTVDAACIGTGYTNTAKVSNPPPLPPTGQFQLFVWLRALNARAINAAVFVLYHTENGLKIANWPRR